MSPSECVRTINIIMSYCLSSDAHGRRKLYPEAASIHEIVGSSQGSLHWPLNFSVDSKFYNFEIMKVKCFLICFKSESLCAGRTVK